MIFTCFSLSLRLLVCSAVLRSLVLYSHHTPSSLLSEMSQSVAEDLDLDLIIRKFSDDLLLDLQTQHINLLFDYTYSVVLSLRIEQYCSSRSLLYFSPSSTPLANSGFLLHPSPYTQASAINLFIEHLGWTSFHIFSSQINNHKTIYQSISSDYLYVLSNTAHQEAYDDFTGKIVKPSGNWKTVVISDGQGVSKFITSLENMRIYKERCVYITNSEGSWGVRRIGGLSIVEEGLEGAQSEGEYEFKAIKRVLSILEKHLGESASLFIDNNLLRRHLEQISDDRVVSSNYSIVNFVPSAKVIGTINNGRVLLNGEGCLFPGNVTEINNSPPIVQISANLVPIEFDGSVNLISYYTNLAILPMLEIINSDPNLLANFQLEIHSTDCGQTYFQYEFASECLKKHYDHLGAVYINTAYAEIANGYIQLFRENNIHIPHTGILYRVSEMYDKELYPELFIPTADLVYMQSILPYILNSFRWKKVIAIFFDFENQVFIDVFMHNAAALNIEIVNDKDHMFIPWSLNVTEFKGNIKNMAQYLYSTQCRIFVLMIDPPYNAFFIESLYDYGFRSGDIVVVNRGPVLNFVKNSELYGLNREKVAELMDGSISLYNKEYVGEYGENLEKTISEIIDPEPTAYTCFQIDSLLLAAHTIDLIINIGRDYEDPADINYFMRQERFTGCSGIVSIDSGGNGRSDLSYTLYNFYSVNGEDMWTEDQVGYCTIGIMFPLQISRQIMWPKCETVIPGDMRIDWKCGFPDDEVFRNYKSCYLLIGFSVLYFVLIVLAGFWLQKKIFDFEYEDLSKEKEIWFEDFVIMLMPVSEALQYISLGPDLDQINPILSYIGSLLSFDIETFRTLEAEEFWTISYVHLSGISLWIICVLLFLSSCYRRLIKSFRGPIVVLAYRVSPLIAKICFVGIVRNLLKLFNCKQGTGSNLTSSFLDNDCKTSCWEGSHLYIAILGFVVLVLYTFLSIAANLTTEYLMDYTNIKTSPFFSLAKSIFHVLLLLLNFHVKSEYPLAFSVICLGLFILWTIFVSRISPFNYGRLSFWQRLISLGLCLYFFGMFIYELTGEGQLTIMIIQFILIVCLLICGVFIQYKFFPSMLFRRKGRNFDKLLKFAFRRDLNPKELTEHELDFSIHNEERFEEKIKIKSRISTDQPREVKVREKFSTIQS